MTTFYLEQMFLNFPVFDYSQQQLFQFKILIRNWLAYSLYIKGRYTWILMNHKKGSCKEIKKEKDNLHKHPHSPPQRMYTSGWRRTVSD